MNLCNTKQGMDIIGYFLSALVGISLGLIGGGGSILMVPILVYVFMLNPVLATSYSLFVVGSTSLVGAINNYRKGLVSIKTALFFAAHLMNNSLPAFLEIPYGLSSITTVFLTRKFIMPVIPKVIFTIGSFVVKQSTAIMVLFAILMLLASIAMIKGRNEVPHTEVTTKANDTLKLLMYGVLVGLATGIFIGGAQAKKNSG